MERITLTTLMLFFVVLNNSITSCETSTFHKLPSICESQCMKNINSTKTAEYCNQHQGLKIEYRCCVNSSASTILGIDLQDCKLTRDTFVNGIANLSHLVTISLEGNSMIKEVKRTDFTNNTQIEYLSLPPKLRCPGGNYSWEMEEYSSSHSVCIGELDPCLAPRNYTCPDNSYCLHYGVNMTNCLCDKGYHGYKCLNEGEFPFLGFGLGISIPSVILCVFLWFTQRRHVKTRPKNT